MTDTNGRPRPAITRDTAPWWQGLRDRQLLVQRCGQCRAYQHPPEPLCMSCGHDQPDRVPAAGTGRIHSFTVHHEPRIPGFTFPYVVVLVELDEGVRVIGNLEGVEPADVLIGIPVVVGFLDIDDEVTVPVFRPADEGSP